MSRQVYLGVDTSHHVRLHELVGSNGETKALAELTDDERRTLNKELEEESADRWFLYGTSIHY